jgi:DnaK suppressor protein
VTAHAGAVGIGAALAARRAEAVARVAALQADLDRMIQSSVGANADDEHDPEGATVAFERAQLATLLAEAGRRVADLDAAARTAGASAAASRSRRPASPPAPPRRRASAASARDGEREPRRRRS